MICYMPKYIDAHCHMLSTDQMSAATACGVGRFIINATEQSNWQSVINLAKQDNVYGAIGVHPWCVDDLADGWDIQLVELLSANPNLMVGEIGLDNNHPKLDVQEIVFRRHLQIAHDLGRVVHVHVVGAWGKTMDILGGAKLPPAMVLHCFSGAPELVPELVKTGAYFSFGSGILDKRHKTMRAAVACVPDDRILVESDAPDVAMPDTIPDTVAEIAKIRGVACEYMADIIYNNTTGLLNEQSY